MKRVLVVDDEEDMLWMLQRNLNKGMMSGSLRFIEKPFDINDVRAIVKEALKVNGGFQGTVDSVDLIDIVPFSALSRATAALKVTTGDQEGMIFFMDYLLRDVCLLIVLLKVSGKEPSSNNC